MTPSQLSKHRRGSKGYHRKWLCSVLGVLLIPQVVYAATFLVNSVTDAVDALPGDGVCATTTGNCTLRAAIQESNALPGQDNITLPSGRYDLSIDGPGEEAAARGDLDISDDVTLTGQSAASTIIVGIPTTPSGGDRVFDIAEGANVVIERLTITGGRTNFSLSLAISHNGSGIRNHGTLLLLQSIVTSNSSFEGTGGGIENRGDMRIIESTISYNSADFAGGIVNRGQLFIQQSSIYNNSGRTYAGGIENSGTLTLLSSTVARNNGAVFGGGLYNSGGGTSSVTNSTISGNVGGGGGISNDGPEGRSVTLLNTIVAGNTSFDRTITSDCGGFRPSRIVSLGNSLLGDPRGCDVHPTDLTGDPGLGAFFDPGLPGQGHFPLLPDSPAIDRGNEATCASTAPTDQLGAPRRGRCDIGAIEFAPPVAPLPTRCQDIARAHPGASDGLYFLFPPSNPAGFRIYCHDMAGTPREYLQLINTGDNVNFAQFGGESSAPPVAVVTTYYTRIRLDPETLLVDISDQTFATSTGEDCCIGPTVVTSVPYGTASDCLASFSQAGRANIDLTGTPFQVNDTFGVSGHAGRGSVNGQTGDDLAFDDVFPMFPVLGQVVNLTGGGSCGGTHPLPRPAAFPPVNTTGGFILQLQYIGPDLPRPPVSRITSQFEHGCVVQADGILWCWGEAASGRLGNGTTAPPQLTPIQTPLAEVQQVDAGIHQTCAVTRDGRAWCWGDGSQYQLGYGDNIGQLLPRQVSGLTQVAEVVTNAAFSCARQLNGTAWCWGYGGDGALGYGGRSTQRLPVQVSPATGLTFMSQLALSDYHACAVHRNGTAWCWGFNLQGQLGDGTTTRRSQPVQVSGLTQVQQIVAGAHHSCALTPEGTVWCWGENRRGELGQGVVSTLPQRTPVQVPGLTGATWLSAQVWHTCAVRTDTTVWCWGRNSAGQLGDGSTTDRPTPVQVVGLADVAQVSAGYYTSCALQHDGSTWCWGAGGSGRLGHGSTQGSLTPVQVQGLP